VTNHRVELDLTAGVLGSIIKIDGQTVPQAQAVTVTADVLDGNGTVVTLRLAPGATMVFADAKVVVSVDPVQRHAQALYELVKKRLAALVSGPGLSQAEVDFITAADIIVRRIEHPAP